jgi:NAD(P)-dependent dehydrogenase (short-subunit alcohol dehydrogenase family)
MGSAPDSNPVADVYAGDTAQAQQKGRATDEAFLFTIEADADADVFGRIANLFNLANVAPESASLHRLSADRVRMTVNLAHVSGFTADMIRRKLEQLTCVRHLTLSRSGNGEPRI